MNILFVVAYAPNPVRVRPYQFIRTLLARGNQVTVASLWTSQAEREDLESLAREGATLLVTSIDKRRTVANLAQALISGTALQASWSWQPALYAMICAALAQEAFDVVHVEHLRASRYALALQEYIASGKAQGKPPVIWDSVDSISALFEQAQRLSPDLKTRMTTTLDLRRTRRAEGRLSAAFPRVVVTSEGDRAALIALADRQGAKQGASARANLRVIPNGVDLQTFRFVDAQARSKTRIVLSGKMSYHANAAAARLLVTQIMPRVWQSHPEAEVWLAGKEPGSEMLEWARDDPKRVTVTGAVADMGAVLGDSTIAAAPLLYGAGIQNKVLEAMACGTPVVATPTAIAALNVTAGVELDVAETVEAFASALIRLLDDPSRRATLARAGRSWVESHHSWDAAAASLENIYHEAMAL